MEFWFSCKLRCSTPNMQNPRLIRITAGSMLILPRPILIKLLFTCDDNDAVDDHIVGAPHFVDSEWPILMIRAPILLMWWPIWLIRAPTLLIWNNKMGNFKFWVDAYCVIVQNVDSGLGQKQQSLSFPNTQSTIWLTHFDDILKIFSTAGALIGLTV